MFGMNGIKHRNNINLRIQELQEFFDSPECKNDLEVYEKNREEMRVLTTQQIPCPEEDAKLPKS